VAALAGIATASVMSVTWNIPSCMLAGLGIECFLARSNGVFVVFGKIPRS
jgi:ribose/xylose/arabinose/galactoside ABC-type transport system permease subunit